MPINSEGERELKTELEKEQKELNGKIEKRNLLSDKFSDLGQKRKTSVSISKGIKGVKGKEVIQAKISQELAAARETFANFTIKETTEEKVRNEIERKVGKMEYR